MDGEYGYYWRCCILRTRRKVNRLLKLACEINLPIREEFIFKLLPEKRASGMAFQTSPGGQMKRVKHISSPGVYTRKFSWGGGLLLPREKFLVCMPPFGRFFIPEQNIVFFVFYTFQILQVVINCSQEVKFLELIFEFKFVKLSMLLHLHIYNHLKLYLIITS